MRRKQRSFNKKKGKGKRREEREFDRRIVSIRRVTRSYEGGRRMRLSVCVVIGDKKGRIGVGLGKGDDVRLASEKAYNDAKNNLIRFNLKGNTIAHEITFKKGAAKIFMKPAAPGTGVVAGGALRSVLEVAGIKDVLTKIIGTSNPIQNAYAAVEALKSLKSRTPKNIEN